MPEEKPAKPKNPTAHKKYEIKGETLERKNKTCPKCGQGIFMAQHKDRSTCGKCNYTEFSKKEEPSAQKTKESDTAQKE